MSRFLLAPKLSQHTLHRELIRDIVGRAGTRTHRICAHSPQRRQGAPLHLMDGARCSNMQLARELRRSLMSRNVAKRRSTERAPPSHPAGTASRSFGAIMRTSVPRTGASSRAAAPAVARLPTAAGSIAGSGGLSRFHTLPATAVATSKLWNTDSFSRHALVAPR